MDKLSISQLRELLEQSAERLQKLPQRNLVDCDVDMLFDKLAQEYNYMFSYIIDCLDQNH